MWRQTQIFLMKPISQRSLTFLRGCLEKNKVIMRKFQPSWFEKWPWLHYNESEDSVLRHTCAKESPEITDKRQNLFDRSRQ